MKKRIFLAILFLLLAFVLVWSVNFFAYGKYVGGSFTHFPGSFGTYVSDADFSEYSYLVSKPAPFAFSGCLSSNNESGTIGIIVWPSFMCNGIKEYGLVLYKKGENGDERGTGYLLYVDKDMSIDDKKDTGLSDEDRENAVALYSAYYPEIMKQYHAMQDVFGLK